MKHSLRHVGLAAVAVLSLAAAPVAGSEGTHDAPTDSTSAAQDDGAQQDADEEEAEPDASATGAQVEDVVVVSRATASKDGASATVLEVGGERVIGGDAEDGTNEGAAFDSGDTELGRVAVAPWSAQAGDDGSRAQTSVAEVTVVDEDTFYAHVLRSRAAANGNGGTSASSDGLALGLGGEDEIRVLSSIWTADGPESALVRQGDDTIGEDADGQCQLEIPSLLHLLCLTGRDGMGGSLVPGDDDGRERASIAEGLIVDEHGVAVLSAGGERNGGDLTDEDIAESPAPDDTPRVLGEQVRPAPDGDDGSLPNTGGGLTVLALGLLLLAAGLVLRRSVVEFA